MHTRSFTAARECVFSDKRSCPINLNGTHLGIVLNNQTDSSHYSQRVHSTNHYRGKAIVAFGPKAPLVSILVPLITGRFCSSAEGKELSAWKMWVSVSTRKKWELHKHYSFLPTVPFICAICSASLVRETDELLHIMGQLVPGTFSTQEHFNNQRQMSAQQRLCFTSKRVLCSFQITGKSLTHLICIP